MALNFNIPMPMSGMDAFIKGFGLTDNLMKQILDRRELQQKQDQFKEELALRKAAAARNAQARADAHRAAMNKLDPTWEMKQLKSKLDYINSLQNDGGTNNATNYKMPGGQQGDGYPALNKMFSGQCVFPGGEIEHGNINLFNRPTVDNPETGGKSTVWSMGIGTPQGEVLIPRVSDDGRILSPEEAKEQFRKTGKHLGIYSSPDEATRAAKAIHQQQEQAMGKSGQPESPGNPLLNGLSLEDIKKALTYKALGLKQPSSRENALTGAARDAESMTRLRSKYGENSREVKEAEAINHAKEQQHEDLSAIRSRQLNGLKPGDTEIKDPNTGQIIGFRKQTTDKQKDAAKNTVLFNQLYPLVQGSAELSGPGATAKFEHAARTYKTNPESRRIIDNLLIADKAASTTAVTEASRFNAGHTNQTFNRLVDTLKSEDIHKKLKKWIKEYEIPAEANMKADKRWQEELNKAEKLANSRIPATMDYYFDPDKQFEAQQQQQNTSENDINNDPLGIR